MLLYHLEQTTNFISFFEEAIKKLAQNLKDQSVVSDIGVGVGMTSALISKMKGVRKVCAYEISESGKSQVPFVLRHFNAPSEKIEYISGTFRNMSVSASCDLIVMCGSFHHCDDADLPLLFNSL
ncbi:hypothetical protein DN730_10375 [Marinomonas piezotolerans]|uniref:Methyltransferase domain-containing protein n=1 Tax=Marinomonas piezotolerans TaxID=2213058 RepID=A0A370U8G5_9GAMM|nr:hypothetical protein DN730_10375 [Marinomonas piezotolerans]